MRRLLLLLLLCNFTGIIVTAQEDAIEALPYGVQIHQAEVADGYVLFSPIFSTEAHLIDNDGNLINQWQSEYRIVVAYLLENGNLLASVAIENGDFPIGGTGRIEEYTWEGDLVWSFEYASSEYMMHHDIAPMPNGNILFTAFESIPREDLPLYGIPESAAGDNTVLFYDMLLEVDRQTSEIVWAWRVSDHFIQSENPDLPNFGYAAEFPNRLDPLYLSARAQLADRTHINGIDYHPQRDQVMVSVWFTSEIWVVDRQLDELVYRWGNPQAMNRGAESNRQLFFQHDPQWLPNDNILIFNNGSGLLQQFSQVIEIVPPYQDDNTYRLVGDSAYEPADPLWIYEDSPRTDFFATRISGAQRLPNGNTLITDGPHGRLFEVTRTGDIVWEYLSPFFREVGDELRRAQIFKVRRYLPDYPAFDGRDLNEGLPLSPVEFTLDVSD